MRKEDILRDEFIGLWVRVVDATHNGYVGMEGQVIDETKNMFAIRTSKGVKWVPKKGTWFMFKINDKFIKIYGNILIARPYERVKKKFPKKWKYDW